MYDVCMHTETRDYWISFPVALCLMTLRQGLSLNLELSVFCFWSGVIVLVRLAGQQVPSRLLYLVPQPKHWGHKYAQSHLSFYMDAGDQNSGPHA